MSKSDRDRRGRPHSGKNCPESQVGGCQYCKTGDWKPFARRTLRRSKSRDIREQQA